jgi:hypothetical protein
MKTRNFALCSLGLAAAITLGGAVTASAQARSDTRIPVRKDQTPPVVETKTDTIRIVRVDTVTLPGRVETRTVTRVDTVTQMQMLPMRALPGVYFGLGAGLAVPYQSWRNTTKDGFLGQVQLGWFPANGAIGLRADASGNILSNRDTDCPNCPKPKLYQGSADVVLRFPLDRMSKLNPVIYFLGGGGIDKFSDFLPYRNTDGKIVTAGESTILNYPGLTLTTATRGEKDWFWHYEGGVGLDFDAGPAHMFVETKFQTINTTNGNSHLIPVVAGFKFGW